MKRCLFLLLFISALTSCSDPVKLCDSCKNESGQCVNCNCSYNNKTNLDFTIKKELKTESINKYNFNKFFRVKMFLNGNDGSYNLYCCEINGVLNYGMYDGNVTIKTNEAINHNNDDLIKLEIDKSGHLKTNSFEFNYSGLLENFNGFIIEEVDASFSYYI